MTIDVRRYHIAICFLSLLIAGCTIAPPEHLPTYPWTGNASAIQVMAARSKLIQTLNCACAMTLIRSDGESVHLDGALAMDLPTKTVRIRAWKFNQPVFDLTLKKNELWLDAPHDEQRKAKVLPAGLSAAQLAQALAFLGPDFFNDPHLRLMDTGGAEFEFREVIDQTRTMIVRVQRSTLTIRQCRLLDPNSRSPFVLDLSQYQPIANTVWPTRVTAINDGSRIELDLQDVKMNTPLPPTAFTPPHHAERLP